MNKAKQKMRVTIVSMILFSAIIIYVFYYISNNTESKKESVSVPSTEVERLLAIDMELNYPATPREVLKLYSRFSKCFYNLQYSEEEFKLLVTQYRKLMDHELLVNNPEEDYIPMLEKEIDQYERRKLTITSYTISEKTAVKYSAKNGRKYAQLQVPYLLKDTSSPLKVTEEFILRADETGKWKILGWKAVNQTEETIEEKEK